MQSFHLIGAVLGFCHSRQQGRQHLLRLLSRFPDVVKEAADKYEPSMITRAVTDIAQAYNKFYYEHRVLDAEPAVSAARVALTKAVKDVIKTGLWLIGIEAPERM